MIGREVFAGLHFGQPALLSFEHNLSSGIHGGGRRDGVQEAGSSAMEVRKSSGEASTEVWAPHQGPPIASFNSMGSTGHVIPDGHTEMVMSYGGVASSVGPCLLDASPPKWGSAVVGPMSYGHPGTHAQSARPLHPTGSSAEALRDLNVGNVGLRGVRLATQGRDLDVVPVVHMPERDPGNTGEVAPPPSLDLLGLDPVRSKDSGGFEFWV